jgi:hypothetical protein
LIPARNASLAVVQGSTSGSNVTIQSKNIRPLKKELNKAVNNAYNARCLQLGYESLRLLIADQ